MPLDAGAAENRLASAGKSSPASGARAPMKASALTGPSPPTSLTREGSLPLDVDAAPRREPNSASRPSGLRRPVYPLDKPAHDCGSRFYCGRKCEVFQSLQRARVDGRPVR